MNTPIPNEIFEIHYVDVEIEKLDESFIKNWIDACVSKEGCRLGFLEIVLCNDNFLLNINKDHLKHNFYTDVITFDYSDHKGVLSGGIYISTERVTENSKKYGVSFREELMRVMIHGVLHLLGYLDDNKLDKMEMTSKENYYLSLLS